MNIFKISLFLFLFLSVNQIYCQNYIDYSSKWYMVSGDSYHKFYLIYKHQIIGDSLINDTLYYKVHTEYDHLNLDEFNESDTLSYYTGVERINVIREDSGRFYSRSSGSEYLIMDHNLELGDTVIINGSDYEIYEVDSIEIGTEYRKIFKTAFGQKIYEGIGSSAGLFEDFMFIGPHPANALLCYQLNGVAYNVHQGNLPFDITIDSCGSLVFKDIITNNSNLIQIEELVVFPNPFTNLVNVEFNETLENKAKVKLYNLNGVELISIDREFINSRIEFDFSELQNGLYILQIQLDDIVLNRKILKL